MPRRPNPELEAEIIRAALRILDRGGSRAITMRSVAIEAGTTTPTIYERFRDRDALIECLLDYATDQVMEALRDSESVEGMFGDFLGYIARHGMRLDLMIETFGARYVRGDKMPAFELLRERLAEETGARLAQCEDLALATASLAMGTAQGMRAAGFKSKHAGEFRRVALDALRLMLSAFHGNTKRKPRR
jgi:AcrR family transcriptional regulator